jgi:hypothetical protein
MGALLAGRRGNVQVQYRLYGNLSTSNALTPDNLTLSHLIKPIRHRNEARLDECAGRTRRGLPEGGIRWRHFTPSLTTSALCAISSSPLSNVT